MNAPRTVTQQLNYTCELFAENIKKIKAPLTKFQKISNNSINQKSFTKKKTSYDAYGISSKILKQ